MGLLGRPKRNSVDIAEAAADPETAKQEKPGKNLCAKCHIIIGSLCAVIGLIAMSPLLNRGFFFYKDPGAYAGITYVIFGILLVWTSKWKQGACKILTVMASHLIIAAIAVIAGLQEIRIFTKTENIFQEMKEIMPERLITFELQTLFAMHVILCVLDFLECSLCVVVLIFYCFSILRFLRNKAKRRNRLSNSI